MTGYTRPVFEVVAKADSAVAKAKAKAKTAPGPSAYNTVVRPNAGSWDVVHIFSCKKMEIPAGAWFALH